MAGLEQFTDEHDILERPGAVLDTLRETRAVRGCTVLSVVTDIQAAIAKLARLKCGGKVPEAFAGLAGKALRFLKDKSMLIADLSPHCVQMISNGDDDTSPTNLVVGSTPANERSVSHLFEILTDLTPEIAGALFCREIYKLASTLGRERKQFITDLINEEKASLAFRRKVYADDPIRTSKDRLEKLEELAAPYEEDRTPDNPRIKDLCDMLRGILSFIYLWETESRYKGPMIPVIDQAEKIMLEQIGDLGEITDPDELFDLFRSLFNKDHIKTVFEAVVALNTRLGGTLTERINQTVAAYRKDHKSSCPSYCSPPRVEIFDEIGM
jgi:hypothetical protein